MKFTKNINYEDIGITPENGWHLIYDWHGIRKIMRTIHISIFILSIILAKLFCNQIRNSIKLIYRLLKESSSDAPWYFYLTIISLILIIFLFIITPIHELIHLFPYRLNVFSNQSWLVLQNGSVGVHFDGKVSKTKVMISLVLPFIILSIIMISVSTIVSKGISYFIYFLLYISILGCYSDIIMFFYILIRLPWNCTIYGNRYKTKENTIGN